MQSGRNVLLVVEDDFLVRLTLVDALSDMGFEVLEAEDAQYAFSLLCERPEIDLMLSDINLPGGTDGFALARAARVVRPDLPVVYASGRYSQAEPHQQVPGARFLAKPFTSTLAVAVINDLLEQDTCPSSARPRPTEESHRL